MPAGCAVTALEWFVGCSAWHCRVAACCLGAARASACGRCVACIPWRLAWHLATVGSSSHIACCCCQGLWWRRYVASSWHAGLCGVVLLACPGVSASVVLLLCCSVGCVPAILNCTLLWPGGCAAVGGHGARRTPPHHMASLPAGLAGRCNTHLNPQWCSWMPGSPPHACQRPPSQAGRMQQCRHTCASCC